jgi:hypothetical protein
MTERTKKLYEEWNRKDTIRYLMKTLKMGKEHSGCGWKILTPDDIDYMNKRIKDLKSEIPEDEYLFMTEDEKLGELKKLREEDIGEFEWCEAKSCSVCGGFVRDDLDFIECGTAPDGDEVFECPFCGSWNRAD